MKSQLNRYVRLVVIFLLLSVPAVVAHFLLVEIKFIISPKFHFLFFIIHFISLVSIIIVDYIKKDLIVYTYLIFLILKMALMVLLVYKFPIIKKDIVLYFGFYWYYLILETLVVVKLLKYYMKVNARTPLR